MHYTMVHARSLAHSCATHNAGSDAKMVVHGEGDDACNIGDVESEQCAGSETGDEAVGGTCRFRGRGGDIAEMTPSQERNQTVSTTTLKYLAVCTEPKVHSSIVRHAAPDLLKALCNAATGVSQNDDIQLSDAERTMLGRYKSRISRPDLTRCAPEEKAQNASTP